MRYNNKTGWASADYITLMNENGSFDEAFQLLKRGSKSEAVTTLQKRLIELKYLKGTADGSFGPATETAVMLFQQASGMNPSGIADEEFGVNFADFRADFAGFGAKKWFSSRLPAAIPGALPGGGEASSNLPNTGISPAGSSAGAVPFFPAAPEIGDKLWNRLPRRNRPSSSSRAS